MDVLKINDDDDDDMSDIGRINSGTLADTFLNSSLLILSIKMVIYSKLRMSMPTCVFWNP